MAHAVYCADGTGKELVPQPRFDIHHQTKVVQVFQVYFLAVGESEAVVVMDLRDGRVFVLDAMEDANRCYPTIHSKDGLTNAAHEYRSMATQSCTGIYGQVGRSSRHASLRRAPYITNRKFFCLLSSVSEICSCT